MKQRIFIFMLFFLTMAVQADELPLLLKQAHADPIQQFIIWQKTARKYNDPLVDIASLATVDSEQYPQQRFMYIHHVDAHGFVFATDIRTNKVHEFKQNHKASLAFLWPQTTCFFQVRVLGKIEQKGLLNVKKEDDSSEHHFYNYVLVPESIQFTVTNKSLDRVKDESVIYTRNAYHGWDMKHSSYEFSKAKSD